MPEPPGLVVKNGMNRFSVEPMPGPSSSTSMCAASRPRRQPYAHAAVHGQGRVGGILDQVDQRLLDLVGIGGQGQRRRIGDADLQALLQARDAAHQLAKARSSRLFGGGSRASAV